MKGRLFIKKLLYIQVQVCESPTSGNSLSAGLRTGYLSVQTAGGVSDRWWLKVRHINGLTYWLTVCLNRFGNWTSPSDNLNNHWKRLCLVSWAAAPCAWTLRAPTKNLLTYLLTYRIHVRNLIKITVKVLIK